MTRLPRSVRLHPTWLAMPINQRERLAAKLGTSYDYLQHVAGGFKLPSLEFVCKLVKEIPSLSFQGFVDAYRARYPH